MSHLINNLPLVIQDAAAVENLASAIKDDMGMLWMLIACSHHKNHSNISTH